jgi:CDP-diacylglycerol---glycerol-3-phosphate 3-phosphatidyltransferase
MIYNTANLLTLSRLGLVVVFFVLLGLKSLWAVPVLLVAGLTDLLDGWVARRFNQVTDFGRVADPVVDKILICSGFIYLARHSPDSVLLQWMGDSLVVPWMASVIVGRELLVTSLRSVAESRGTVFQASFWGKSKMVVQFVTLAYVILLVALWKKSAAHSDTWLVVGHVLVWATLFFTVMSGIVYLIQIERLVRKRDRA